MSPITQRLPGGTVTLKAAFADSEFSLGTWMYGSSREMPLTLNCPDAVQQTTVSPGSPMTRLMRWFSLSDALSPTKASAPSSIPVNPVAAGGGASNHPPGSRKTTTSPCSIGIRAGTSSLTRMRSWTRRVPSIDSDGMKNARTRNAFTSAETRIATITITRRSRTNFNVLELEPGRPGLTVGGEVSSNVMA